MYILIILDVLGFFFFCLGGIKIWLLNLVFLGVFSSFKII